MNPATAYFFVALSLQAVFTAAVIVLVARRYPARVRLYRWVAPAAVPLMLFTLVSYAFVRATLDFLSQVGRPFDATMLAPLGRFAIGYGVLWLIGVLVAGLLIRLVRR
jgi:hypothetical protein